MKKNSDQIYLERLYKSLQSLLKRLNKGKPGSAFTKTEIRAFLDFNIDAPKGLSGFVRKFHDGLWLIREAPKAKRSSVLFYIQMLHSHALRLLSLLNQGDIKKLNVVQKELKANNVMEMKRRNYVHKKDEVFEKMILRFMKEGGEFHDNIYKNIAILPALYFELLNYYLKHKKDISGTKQWYDFLVISNYMLFGIKLEILLLQRLKRR